MKHSSVARYFKIIAFRSISYLFILLFLIFQSRFLSSEDFSFMLLYSSLLGILGLLDFGIQTQIQRVLVGHIASEFDQDIRNIARKLIVANSKRILLQGVGIAALLSLILLIISHGDFRNDLFISFLIPTNFFLSFLILVANRILNILSAASKIYLFLTISYTPMLIGFVLISNLNLRLFIFLQFIQSVIQVFLIARYFVLANLNAIGVNPLPGITLGSKLDVPTQLIQLIYLLNFILINHFVNSDSQSLLSLNFQFYQRIAVFVIGLFLAILLNGLFRATISSRHYVFWRLQPYTIVAGSGSFLIFVGFHLGIIPWIQFPKISLQESVEWSAFVALQVSNTLLSILLITKRKYLQIYSASIAQLSVILFLVLEYSKFPVHGVDILVSSQFAWTSVLILFNLFTRK